jgi:MerR family transcriptional regulator, thiopeptide resistance regulator
MTRLRTYQVKDVARLTGVSVRTLHHYDAIGLLAPSGRTAAGYRLYTDADLLRLQQILIGRELGLPLEEIRQSLDDPCFDRKAALLDQRQRLRDRARQAEAMIRAIDTALAAFPADASRRRALDGSATTGEITMAKLFDGFDPSRYEDEARQRWGDTDAYAQMEKRTKRYTPDDWKALMAEQGAVYTAAFAALEAGKTPSSAEAMDIAERHRLSIDRWFYPCSHTMHQGLASMYESDDRFRQSIDTHGEGLTTFLAEAIRANAGRSGG